MVLNKSIVGRVFLYFILFSFLAAAILFWLLKANISSIPFYYFAAVVCIFIVYFLLVYFYEIVRPIKILLKEMTALLSGKKYRKIITTRVDEIGIIAHFFNEVTKSFEKVTKDIVEGKRMLGELEIASDIQKSILPSQTPSVNGLEIVAKTRPAVELGGDNFDFLTKNNNTFIYVGDVTGHGVPAALIMTMVHTLIHTLVDIFDNAYDVVVNTNKNLKSRIKSTMFMTMLMLRWDSNTQKMSFVGCGHEHLVIYRAETGKCEILKTGGIALGMVPDNSKLIQEQQLPLKQDDVVILYTDGLTEGRNMAGEMYKLERLISAVERFAPQYGPDGIVNHVAMDYSHFVENHVQDDDVTLIAIKFTGKQANESQIQSTNWEQQESDTK